MSSLDENQAQMVRDMVAGRSQQMIVEKRVGRGLSGDGENCGYEPTVEPELRRWKFRKISRRAAPPSPAPKPMADKPLERVPLAVAPAANRWLLRPWRDSLRPQNCGYAAPSPQRRLPRRRGDEPAEVEEPRERRPRSLAAECERMLREDHQASRARA